MVVSQKDIDEGSAFEVEYWGGPQIHVQGLVTGATYTFSGLSRAGMVDPRDAPGYLGIQISDSKVRKK